MALLNDFREKHGIINLVNHIRVALEDLNQQDLYGDWVTTIYHHIRGG